MPFAPAPSSKAVTSFLGVRNTSPPRSIPDNALQVASDVDLDDVGIISRRHGFQQAASSSTITTGYSTLDRVSYVVDNGVLCRVSPSLELIPITASTATAFADKDGILFTNDGLRVKDDRAIDLNFPVGMGQSAPTLIATVGDWPAGRYTAVYCYRSDTTGLEGPTSAPSSITITEGQRVSVAPPIVPTGYTAIVYITATDGTVFYDSDGLSLNPLQIAADPFPVDGTSLAVFDSSLFVSLPQANGSTLVAWSFPFHPHLFSLSKNYIVVPGEVTGMYGLEAGVVITTNRDVLLFDGTAVRALAPYGTPKGRPITPSATGTVFIYTNRGVCEAMPFVNHTEQKALFAPGESCSTTITEHDGVQQFITLTDGTGAPFNTRT